MKRTRTSTLTAALLAAALFACTPSSTTPVAEDASTSTAVTGATDSVAGGPGPAPATADDNDHPLPVFDAPTTTAPTESVDTVPSLPAFDPVELAAVEGPAPVQPPPTPPAPVDLAPAPVVIGDLSSNAPGCASDCITRAVLSPGTIGSPVSIEVTTSVATRTTLWMSTKSIGESADGTPTFDGSPAPVASSGVFRRAWSAQIGELLPNHRYRAILRVVDRFGNERFLTGEIHTPHGQPAEDLAAAGGCTYQCITMGVVQPTTDHDRVALVIATDVATRLAISVSTSEPGWIGGSPVLPADALIDTPNELATNWNIPVGGLEGDTVYHVIVKAQDADGNIAHRVGQFRTAPERPTKVLVTVERIFLTYDGDPGVNRGEVYFVWGDLSGGEGGFRQFAREDDGLDFVPAETNSWVVEVAAGGTLPISGATVWEEDWDGHYEASCWEHYVLTREAGQRFIDLCDVRGNGAFAAPMTVEDLVGLQRCSTYGFIEGEDDACLLLTTVGGNEDYAQMKVLVSYEIL